jgi:aldehyde dehydrogenase (NAD+)
MGHIESGKTDGATVHIGGNRVGNDGYFIQPTVFAECQQHMKIVREEIFGPVAWVLKFKTEASANTMLSLPPRVTSHGA